MGVYDRHIESNVVPCLINEFGTDRWFRGECELDLKDDFKYHVRVVVSDAPVSYVKASIWDNDFVHRGHYIYALIPKEYVVILDDLQEA